MDDAMAKVNKALPPAGFRAAFMLRVRIIPDRGQDTCTPC